MDIQKDKKRLVILAGILVLALFSVFLVSRTTQTISRRDKTAVTVRVLPNDSAIKVDGKETRGSTIYVSPGKHEFSAGRQGFKDDKQNITVGSEPFTIGLLPEPDSPEAEQWLAKDNNIHKREEIGAIIAEQRGNAIREATPITSILPRTDPTAPFMIDYGYRSTDTDSVYLLVKYSTAEGRTRAIQWIKDQGFDITELDIIFSDYYPPYEEGVS